MQKIEFNKIFIEDIVSFQKDNLLNSNFKLTVVPRNYNGLTCDSALYDIVIGIAAGASYDVLKTLATWLINSYKASKIKKFTINNETEVEVSNLEVDELIKEIHNNLKKAP